ncbi:MAG TPA: outer membrane lipid asymmetry maintenance protein MlaD [Gammaproteobacteria bacterium]|nr:outer membrane lipid asymmetry maintenance protein MlaD [Gammaproteobacteria bacterium]
MHTSRTIEILVGVFVAAGLAAFFMLAMKVSNISSFAEKDSYVVKASFDNIGGLKTRSPVRIGGVRIGRVTAIEYDDNKLEAIVTMHIYQKHARIPKDSAASIYTAGLLGEQYINLDPGGAEGFLKNGSVIEETQSAFVLERLIGRFLTQASGTGK